MFQPRFAAVKRSGHGDGADIVACGDLFAGVLACEQEL
jgi:hypothetical protein